MNAYHRLINTISDERLSSYSILCPSGDKLKLMGAYYWNLCISKHLYPFIHVAEITLRNAICLACQQYFMRENWLDLVVSKDNTAKDILSETKEELIRKKQSYCFGDIVAKLSFGFWQNLLKRRVYSDRNFKYCLWPNLLCEVFPQYHINELHKDKSQISKRFQEIRILRNRLFHHEPIWKFKTAYNATQSLQQLRNKFSDIYKAIGWMSKLKKNYLKHYGFLDDFYNHCNIDTLNQYMKNGIKLQCVSNKQT